VQWRLGFSSLSPLPRVATANKFDVILDTVSAAHDVAKLLPTLKVSGTYVCLGAVGTPMNVSPSMLLARNLRIMGSGVGGVPETQQMLDFCAKHNIQPEIKVIPAYD
jgi:alcohol dehydrogenase (NADP+)